MTTHGEYLVKNYMRKDVVTLTEDATFADVVSAMITKKTNGIVVIDKNGRVVGIISSWDLIEHMVPDYLEADLHLASFTATHSFVDDIERVKNDPIKNFMTDNVYTIHEDNSLMQASTLLSEFKIRQLPVVDENDKLVGYINRTDIKNAMGDVLNLK